MCANNCQCVCSCESASSGRGAGGAIVGLLLLGLVVSALSSGSSRSYTPNPPRPPLPPKSPEPPMLPPRRERSNDARTVVTTSGVPLPEPASTQPLADSGRPNFRVVSSSDDGVGARGVASAAAFSLLGVALLVLFGVLPSPSGASEAVASARAEVSHLATQVFESFGLPVVQRPPTKSQRQASGRLEIPFSMLGAVSPGTRSKPESSRARMKDDRPALRRHQGGGDAWSPLMSR
jgi:hypothetical protein